MILVFAGRRPGPEFPADNEEFVSQQLRQMIGGLAPRVLVGSAAAGTDLLAIAAGVEIDARVDVILAGSRSQFREASVTDKPDSASWANKYDSLLAAEGVQVTELPVEGEPADADFRAVTHTLLERATQHAASGSHGEDEEVVLVAVAQPRAEPDHTEELVEMARAARHLVLRIDPARTRDDVPQAFVAMPFGVKPVEARKWSKYDADLTYHRMLAPALIDGGYRPMRADTEALAEFIDRKMLRRISQARLMVADLTGLNPNVMWELGLRHGWRRAGTVLVTLEGGDRPFDTQRVPTYSYRREETEVGDRDAVEAIRGLQPVLEDVERGDVDSPVFANFNSLGEVELPLAAESELEAAPTEFLTQITLARDVRDPAALEGLEEEIARSELPAQQKDALLEQVGVQFISLRLHHEAVRVLRPLAEADRELRKAELQQRYAHALIRSDSDETETDARLREAQSRLQILSDRGLASGELFGLLGSASKKRVELKVRETVQLDQRDLASAVDAYRRGFEVEPGDFYPGINLVALLRLRGQHWGGSENDLADARSLVPVVRFAVKRNHNFNSDVWAVLTLAEADLHEFFLDGDPGLAGSAADWYRNVGRQCLPNEEGSALAQLELCAAAGDDREVLARMREALVGS